MKRHQNSKTLFYDWGDLSEREFLEKEFEWSLKRRVGERVERGFIKTYKPMMDDEPYRVFNRLKDYRDWCEKKLPPWLGYGKAK